MNNLYVQPNVYHANISWDLETGEAAYYLGLVHFCFCERIQEHLQTVQISLVYGSRDREF